MKKENFEKAKEIQNKILNLIRAEKCIEADFEESINGYFYNAEIPGNIIEIMARTRKQIIEIIQKKISVLQEEFEKL